MGLGGRGHDTQTCQYRQVRGPDKPSQALTLEASGCLLRKVTWQTTSCWQKRRATLGLFWKGSESENSVPFWCKHFCSAFHKIFFVILAKFLVIIDIVFLFKIRSQYTWFSLFWLCTEVQKSQPLSPLSPQDFPPTLVVCSWLSKRWVCRLLPTHRVHLTPPATPPKKWSNMQLVFQHGPISRESKNIKTIVTIWNGYSRK